MVAEEAMIGEATGAMEGIMEAFEGARMAGTEAALALARWILGMSTHRITGKGWD